MNKIAQIKIFNNCLDQLFDFLENDFSFYKSDITLTKGGVQLVRKGNPRLVVEIFMKYVYPYKKEVFECNEQFFVDFENNLNDTTLTAITPENFMMGLKIKRVWLSPDITQIQKAKIWYFFQKLIKFGEKVII